MLGRRLLRPPPPRFRGCHFQSIRLTMWGPIYSTSSCQLKRRTHPSTRQRTERGARSAIPRAHPQHVRTGGPTASAGAIDRFASSKAHGLGGFNKPSTARALEPRASFMHQQGAAARGEREVSAPTAPAAATRRLSGPRLLYFARGSTMDSPACFPRTPLPVDSIDTQTVILDKSTGCRRGVAFFAGVSSSSRETPRGRKE